VRQQTPSIISETAVLKRMSGGWAEARRMLEGLAPKDMTQTADETLAFAMSDGGESPVLFLRGVEAAGRRLTATARSLVCWYIGQTDLEGGLKECALARADDPSSDYSLQVTAQLMMSNGRLADGLALFKKAELLGPARWRTYNNECAAFVVNAPFHSEAGPACQMAVQLSNRHADAVTLLARLESRRFRFSAAIALLDSARRALDRSDSRQQSTWLDLTQEIVTTRMYSAASGDEEHDTEKAIVDIDSYLAILPSKSSIRWAKADALSERGEWGKAAKIYDALVADYVNNVGYSVAVFQHAADAADSAMARQFIGNAIRIDTAGVVSTIEVWHPINPRNAMATIEDVLASVTDRDVVNALVDKVATAELTQAELGDSSVLERVLSQRDARFNDQKEAEWGAFSVDMRKLESTPSGDVEAGRKLIEQARGHVEAESRMGYEALSLELKATWLVKAEIRWSVGDAVELVADEERVARRWIEVSPADLGPYKALRTSLERQGKSFNELVGLLDKQLGHDPTNADLYLERARLATLNGDSTSTRLDLLGKAESVARSGGLLTDLGAEYVAMANSDAAARVLALALDRGANDFVTSRGFCWAMSSVSKPDLDVVRSICDRAIRLSGSDQERSYTNYLRGSAELAAGDPVNSVAFLDRAVAQDATRADYRFKLANALSQVHRETARAIQNLAQAVRDWRKGSLWVGPTPWRPEIASSLVILRRSAVGTPPESLAQAVEVIVSFAHEAPEEVKALSDADVAATMRSLRLAGTPALALALAEGLR
jgi:hypothetical protein